MSILSQASFYADYRAGTINDLIGANDGTFAGSTSWTHDGLRFMGGTDSITYGDILLTVQTVTVFVKVDSGAEDILDLDGGTHTIEIIAGTVTATGFSNPVIYINGALSSTLNSHEFAVITVTTDTGISVSDLTVGRETNSLNGGIKAVSFFGTELSVADIALLSSEIQSKTFPKMRLVKSNANLRVNPNEPNLEAGYNMILRDGMVADLGSGSNNLFPSAASSPDFIKTPLGEGATFIATQQQSLQGTGTVTIGANGLTVAAWINPNVDAVLIRTIFGSPTLSLPLFWIGTGGEINLAIDDLVDGDGAILNAPAGLVDNRWYHVAITWHPTNGFTAYRDGEQIATGATNGSGASWTNFSVGIRLGGDYYDGIMGPKPMVILEEKDATWIAQEYNQGRTALAKSDWGINEGTFAVSMDDFISNSPWRSSDNGTTVTILSDETGGQRTKLLQFDNGGEVYIPTSHLGQTPEEAAFGKWEFSFMKPDAVAMVFVFISDTSSFGTGNAYQININPNESVSLNRIDAGVLTTIFATSAAAFPIDTEIKCTITRDNLGEFSLFFDDVLLTGGFGSNPVTDTTYTTSSHFLAVGSAGGSFYLGTRSGDKSFNKSITI